jgi:Mg/Co/Ni transporter MgtE
VEGGVLFAAGSLGAAAASLVVRGLVGDQATSKSVRETLRRLA